jgi:hypothetical protein
VFYQEMLGSVMTRVGDITKTYNQQVSVHRHWDDEKVPMPLRVIYVNLPLLTKEELSKTLGFVYRNIQLVQLNEHWEVVRNSLTKKDHRQFRLRRYHADRKILIITIPTADKGRTGNHQVWRGDDAW